MPGSSSWMPYAPQGVKGFDEAVLETALLHSQLSPGAHKTEPLKLIRHV